MFQNLITLTQLVNTEKQLVQQQTALFRQIELLNEQIEAIRILKRSLNYNQIETELNLPNEIDILEKNINSKSNNFNKKKAGRTIAPLPTMETALADITQKKHKVFWVILKREGATAEDYTNMLLELEPSLGNYQKTLKLVKDSIFNLKKEQHIYAEPPLNGRGFRYFIQKHYI